MNCKCGHEISTHDKGGCQHSDRTKGGIDLVCKCGLSPDAIAEAEIASLRAQLAEAREIISSVAEISPWSLAEADYLRQKAKAYLDKVTTA